jgi:hypothetical protein
MLSVTYNPFMLSVVMQSVVMQSVVVLSVVAPNNELTFLSANGCTLRPMLQTLCDRKLQLYSYLMQVLREKMHEIIVSAYLDYDRNLQLYKCLYHRPSGHLVLTKIVWGL